MINRELLPYVKLLQRTFEGVPYQNVISIDETCIYERMTPTKRWTKKGTRLYLPIQRLESKKYYLIIASTHEKIVHTMLVRGSVNGQLFSEFIDGIPSKDCYILMDNVNFHKSAIVKQAMVRKGFTALYASPYSPEWNPAEMFFSYLKRTLRKSYHQRTIGIEEKIRDVTKSIKTSIFTSWFQHVWKQIRNRFQR